MFPALKYFILFSLVGLLILSLMGCEKVVEKNDTQGTLIIRLTDTPFPIHLIDQAKVTINKIEIREPDADSEEGPYMVLFEAETAEEELEYDLLELQNGVTADLVQLEVPEGVYDLVRLYVSHAEIIVMDENDQPIPFNLKVPSGPQSGIKIFIDPAIIVVGGLTEELLLDFDASRSFVVQGNPETPAGIKGFHFKPVVRAINVSVAGQIAGKVTNSSLEPIEGAVVWIGETGIENAVYKAYTDSDGQYKLIGVAAGKYTVYATKEGENYNTAESLDVIVNIGNTTEVNFIIDLQ